MNRNIKCWLFVCLLAILIPFEVLAQIKVEGVPESFLINEKSAVIIPDRTLDSIYPANLKKEDINLGIPNRYGIVQNIDIDIKKDGVATYIKNKGTIYRYRLHSPDAYSIGIQFKTYNLPENSELFIYDPTKTSVEGAFTSLNNKPSGYLSLADFKGNDVIIEYFEADSVEFPGELIIGSVSQAYKNIAASSKVRIGINCPEGDNWQVEKNSVCLINFIDGKYAYYCTGSLVNNVKQDGTPYFLTANHCISSNMVAQTLIACFNYENSTCNSTDATMDHSLSGATLKANNSSSDFSLLLLDETPPDDYGPYFAGWDATGNPPQSGVCIHHPEGTATCISIDNSEISGNKTRVLWDDKSISAVNSHWEVFFDEGGTEAGSSGSPLFDQNKHIVGQLHGGDDVSSLYGKLSLSWTNRNQAAWQLKTWLDPNNSGVLVLDGFGVGLAPEALFSSQMTLACTNNPVSLHDESLYSPQKWLWKISPSSFQFVDNTDSTSQNPVVEFLDEGQYTIELIAGNIFGEDSSVLTNYIQTRSKLPVSFPSMPLDTTVCGCDLSNLNLVAAGAYNYSFSISDTTYFNEESRSDSVFLSLAETAQGSAIFSTWVTVTGSHGSCVASDSVFLHVMLQENDNFSNAIQLHLGQNAYFSNQCGTVESGEPSPNSGICYSQITWCPNETGTTGNLSNTIWFSFVAPPNGHVIIDTHGFDDQIALYQSKNSSGSVSGFSDLKLVAANDNRSLTEVTSYIDNTDLTPGQTYWLQLDGRNGAYGDATIDLISNMVMVYPNQSDGKFNVLVSTADSGTAEYSVYTMNGQRIIHNSASITIQNNLINLDLTEFAEGIYMLNVKIGNINSTHKLLVF